jgi:hypothetical protein
VDPALLALATSGANALISLMTTDLWERAKSGVSGLFARGAATSEFIENELEESRAELEASAARGDLEDTTSEIQQMWKGKFRRLLAADPDLAADVREIVGLWEGSGNAGGNGPRDVIQQTATAYDNSRIYQQGSGIQNNG